jgi:hypothetical protein
MKSQEKIFLAEEFILHFCDGEGYTQEDIYNWIGNQYNGIFPDHNKFFEIRKMLYYFSIQTRGTLYKLNISKAKEFLKNNSDKLKQFENKLKEVKK